MRGDCTRRLSRPRGGGWCLQQYAFFARLQDANETDWMETALPTHASSDARTHYLLRPCWRGDGNIALHCIACSLPLPTAEQASETPCPHDPRMCNKKLIGSRICPTPRRWMRSCFCFKYLKKKETKRGQNKHLHVVALDTQPS